MKLILVIFTALLLTASLCFGQVSINFLEIPADWGMISTYWGEADTAAGIPVNVGQTGGGNTWNFADVDSTNSFSQTIVSADATPFGNEFPSANLVMETDDLVQFGLEGPGYMFFHLTTSELALLGLGFELQGTPTPIVFQNPATWAEMPLDYGDDWTSGFFEQIFFDSAGMEYRIDIEGTFNMDADAFGSLIIPAGTQNALRIRNDIQIDITVYLMLWGIPIEVYADQMSYISYIWMAENLNMSALIMSQEGETNPNFTLASTFSALADITIGDYTAQGTPVNPPIIIPPGGGSFSYQAYIHNNLPEPSNIEAWTGIFLPSGSYYGPIILRNLTLPVGGSVTRNLTQVVPGGLPAGTYYLVVFIGDQSENEVMARGGFTFTVTADDYAAVQPGEWETSGWDEEESSSFDLSPLTFDLLPCYPNPFNASTTIPFTISAPGEVNLVVYDALGREIQALGIGHWASGNHSVVWNAGGYASGVYMVRLSNGESSQTMKLMLVK